MCKKIMIPDTNGIPLDEVMKRNLVSSAKWVKILCVSFLIFTFWGVVVFFAFPILSKIGSVKVSNFLYILLFLLDIYPTIKGLQFAKSLKKACIEGSQSELEKAFTSLRLCIIWFTILAIINLAVSFFT